MPRSRSMAIQSEVTPRRPALPCTAPAVLIADACSASASVRVDLPASGWLITAKVRRRPVSLRTASSRTAPPDAIRFSISVTDTAAHSPSQRDARTRLPVVPPTGSEKKQFPERTGVSPARDVTASFGGPPTRQQHLTADRPVACRQRGPQRVAVPRRHLGEYRRARGQQAKRGGSERAAQPTSARVGFYLIGRLPAPGQPPAEYQAARAVAGLPGAYLVTVAMRTAYSRVGVARDLAEIKARALAMGPRREQGVVGANVRADAVSEGDEEPRAQGCRVVAWRQLGLHPLRVNRGEHIEVRRERDDRGGLARQAGVYLDLPVGRRHPAVRRGGEHIQ